MNAITPIVASGDLAAVRLTEAEPQALWTGQPQWISAALRIWKVCWVAVYFALLLIDGARLALQAHGGGDIWNGEARLLAISLGVTGGLLALAVLTARTTRYSIDGRAVTLRYGIALPATLVIPFTAIEQVGVRIHRDGSGDVALRLKPGPGVIYPKLWPHVRPWRILRAEPMMRCLPDAGVAATLLCRALSAQSHRRDLPPRS